MERKRDEESEAECVASLEEALTCQCKVVKVTVDKWCVDKGFGFGRAPTGEVVFIHASAVQVLKCSRSALTRVQVVRDDARAQRWYRARRACGQDVWKAGAGQEESEQGGPTSEASSGTDSRAGSSV